MKPFHFIRARVDAVRPKARRLGRRRGGQALIEMAFVMSALLVITIGLVQYGILYNAVGTLTYLAREGARFSGVHAMDSTVSAPVFVKKNGVGAVEMQDSAPDLATRRYIRFKARPTAITEEALPDSSIAITPAPGADNRKSGESITVTITYDLRRKIFVGSRFPGISRFVGPQTITMTQVIE